MRRPLCLIALGYTFILWIVLQLVPWRPQTFPDWEKRRVWAEGTVAAKEYKRSSDGEIRLLVSMENVVLHETVPKENDGEEGTEVLPQMLLCRSGNGSRESARGLDDALPMGTRVIMLGTFRSFPEATNAGEFYSARYYDTLGYSAQLTGGELAGILSEVQGGIHDQPQNADCSQEGGIHDRPQGASGGQEGGIHDRLQDASRGQEGGKLLWIFRVKSRWKENCHLFRLRLGDVLSDCLPGQSAELLKAMLLGEKGGIDPELKNLYQGAGIVHILAISGLHITMIGMGLFNLLRRLRVPFPPSAILAALAVWLYGQLAGGGPSSFRAIVMFLLHMLAILCHRTYDLLTAVSVAAILLLIQEPLYLYHSGFLFSFSAVLGIALLSPVFEAKPLKGLAVLFATLPVSLYEYGTVSLYAFVFNLAVLPLMSVVMAGGFFVLLLGSFWPLAGKLAGILPVAILSLYEILCRVGEQLPGSRMILGAPSAGQTVIYVALLGGAVFLSTHKEIVIGSKNMLHQGNLPFTHERATIGGKNTRYQGNLLFTHEKTTIGGTRIRYQGNLLFKHEKTTIGGTRIRDQGNLPFTHEKITIGSTNTLRQDTLLSVQGETAREQEEERSAKRCGSRRTMCVVLLIAALGVLLFRGQRGLEIHAVDVGQGDGILIRADGVNLWVDGGSTDKQEVAEYQILPLLRYYGVRKLDCCILTHEDEDHVNGLRELLKESKQSGSVQIGLLCLPSVREENKTGAFRDIEALAKEQGIPIRYLKEGDLLRTDRLSLRCLHPEENSTYENANERSTTMYLRYGEFTCLLNGDLEKEGEKRLLAYVQEQMEAGGWDEEDSGEETGKNAIPLTLLHVAHHGSRNATSEEFLEVFRPQYAFVSCGKDNSYGHPHKETLERLEQCGVRLFDTRMSGELTFWTDGKRLKVKEYRR